MFSAIAPGFGLNLAVTAAVTLACVLALWLLSIRLKDVSIIDIFWGPGFAAVAAIGLWRSPDATVREQVFGLQLPRRVGAKAGCCMQRERHLLMNQPGS